MAAAGASVPAVAAAGASVLVVAVVPTTSAALRACASTFNARFLDAHILMRSPPCPIRAPAWWSVSSRSCTSVLSPRNASSSPMYGFCSTSMSHGAVCTSSSRPTIETSRISHNFILVSLLPSAVFQVTVGHSVSDIAILRRRSSRVSDVDSCVMLVPESCRKMMMFPPSDTGTYRPTLPTSSARLYATLLTRLPPLCPTAHVRFLTVISFTLHSIIVVLLLATFALYTNLRTYKATLL